MSMPGIRFFEGNVTLGELPGEAPAMVGVRDLGPVERLIDLPGPISAAIPLAPKVIQTRTAGKPSYATSLSGNHFLVLAHFDAHLPDASLHIQLGPNLVSVGYFEKPSYVDVFLDAKTRRAPVRIWGEDPRGPYRPKMTLSKGGNLILKLGTRQKALAVVAIIHLAP